MSEQTPPTLLRIRAVARDGKGYTIITTGRRKQHGTDLYAALLATGWKQMLGVLAVMYVLLNLGFATAYFYSGGITNARAGSFADAFFFSVQTLATIGYGSMAPHGIVANLLVTIEAMIGFAYYGVVTGLMFSKFSRPTARVLFSDRAVIAPHNGRPHFMMRLINERHNRVVNARAKMTLMCDEITAEGTRMRRSHNLTLVRRELPILRLSWTLMHLITESSPLYGITDEKLDEMQAEIIISVTGIDETFAQTIHAQHSYVADEIVCNGRFEDIISRVRDNTLEIRYDKFHSILEGTE